jgi:ubiquinone/menaquinone biosynthesis C-methylase UbiE
MLAASHQEATSMQDRTHDAHVAAQFGAQAQSYLTSAVHAQGEDLERLAALIGARPEASALDLGCGGGHVSFLLAPRVGKVVAYDLSEAVTAMVRAEAARRGLANLDAHQGAAERLPYADATFDIVVSRYSAHHWRDAAAGLCEARRVLKPGGLAVFMDAVSPGSPLLDTWLQALELLRDPSHVRNCSLEEWRAMLTAAGLKPGEASRFRLRLEFSSWIKRMNTPEAHAQAIRSLQARAPSEAAKHFEFGADGSFTLDTMLIAAET